MRPKTWRGTAFLATLLLLAGPTWAGAPVLPPRGDANASGVVNVSDVLYLINVLFAGGPAPLTRCGGDANGDALTNISDILFLINHLFAGGPAPGPCTNLPPQLPPLPDRIVTLGETLSVAFGADDPDPGDALAYSLMAAPAGAQLSPAGSPLFSFTPSTGQVGPHVVTVHVEDQGTLADEASFQVTVLAANRPPQLGAQADARIPTGAPFARTLAASDPDAGDVLTFSLVEGPAGMNVTGSLLSWPSPQPGTSFVTVRVSDGAGGLDDARFALTGFSAQPPIAGDDAYEVVLGQTLQVAAPGVLENDVDPEGGALTAQKLTDPDKGLLTAFGADGAFTFQAPAPPPPPVFAVKEKWWVHDGFSYAHPLVADLNDDGFPDVVHFASNNILRALDGRDGTPLFSINGIAGCGFYLGAGAGNFAVGDLDGNGAPEIVALGNCAGDVVGGSGPVRVVAVNHDGTLHWKSPVLTNEPLPAGWPTMGATSLTLARLAEGGPVKILAQRWIAHDYGPAAGPRGCRIVTGDAADEGVACSAVFVLSAADGSLEKVLKAPEPYPNAFKPHFGTNMGNYYNFPAPVVADLDGDGVVEIVGSHVVHENGGAVRWAAPKPSLDTAVADLDGDGHAEVLMLLRESTDIVRTLAVYDRNGAARWTFPLVLDGGRLVVADVDRDGAPDILVTANRDLWVFDRDGRVLWTHKITSPPPAGDATGCNRPAVFDLDGDGFPEVILQHWKGVSFLDGRDGHEKAFVDSLGDTYNYDSYSSTPVVADMDGDGHADVVVPLRCGSCGNMGIRVLTSQSDDWQPAPGAWNQLNNRPSTVDASGAIAFDASVPADFRVQASIGTPVDPRERTSTTFTYAASNGALASDPATVTIDLLPENRPPVITSTPPTRARTNTDTTYQLTATDPDQGDTKTWSLEVVIPTPSFDDPHVSIDPVSGLLSFRIAYTPANRSYAFVVRVTDSQGAIDTQAIVPVGVTSNATVPNVIGQTQGAAAATLLAASLTAGSVAEVFNPAAAGVVVAQSPAAGNTLPQGERVALTVSKGAAPVDVPCVLGVPETQAVTQLSALGFTAVITRQFDARPRGEVLSQDPAPASFVPPGPVALVVSAGTGLELRLASGVVNAGTPLAFTLVALDVNGSPIAPPPATYGISPLAPDFVSPAPNVSGATITSTSATRGGFRLTGTETGGAARVVTADFVVTNPSNVNDFDPQALFAQESAILEGMDAVRAELDAARAANDQAGMAAALTDMVDLWRPLDPVKLGFATTVSPTGGFPLSPAEMVAAGYPYNADDVLLPEILDAINALLMELREDLESGGHLPLLAYAPLYDELAARVAILESLAPSPTGVLANQARYDAVVAHRLPAATTALLNAVADAIGVPPLGRAPRRSALALPITLSEVATASSIHALLAKKLYLGVIKRVGLSAAFIAAKDALKEYTNASDLVSVIAGASLSMHVFEAPFSAVEVAGINSSQVTASSVLLIGPTAVDSLTGLVDAIKDAFKLKVNPDPDKVVKDLKQVYNKLSSLADAASGFVDALNPENFKASRAVRGCLFDSSPGCTALVYDGGFKSVYTCPEATFCPPFPTILFAWDNTTGGLALATPVFFPTPAPKED